MNSATFRRKDFHELLYFEALYVIVPYRQISLQTIGLHIRNSWRGTLVAEETNTAFSEWSVGESLHIFIWYLGDFSASL
jgi:hypothetical protein